jgi:transcriptional regulator with XRE-family HTH domain
MSVDSIEVGSALRAELARRGLSQEQVAAEFNVTQPRISRVLKGEFTHRSELVRMLCATYLEGTATPNLEDYAHEKVAANAFQRAVQALRLMWDGSADHAERLTELISAVRRSQNCDEPEDCAAQQRR